MAIEPMALAERADATTWDGLSRLAFAADWDPEAAIDWSRPIELGEARDAWVEILHQFYEGEWQGLEIIQRLMNRAAHRYGLDEMVTYYSTQCYDESKHLFVFRRYLAKVGAPRPAADVRPARRNLDARPTRGGALDPGNLVHRDVRGRGVPGCPSGPSYRSDGQRHGPPHAQGRGATHRRDEARRAPHRARPGRTGEDGAARCVVARLLRLAEAHLRTLRASGERVGIDADAVLARALARMATMDGFARTFQR